MNKEIKINTTSWLILVALIVVSFFIAETHQTHLFLIISLLSAIKFATISFQFMEVKHAHLVWKFVSILFIIIYLLVIFLIS